MAKPKTPQGPSEAELLLIRGVALELRASLPTLSQDDAIHFASEAVKEQRMIAQAIAQLMAAVTRGEREVAWLEVTVFKPQSNMLETGREPEVVCVFAGPSQPGKNHSAGQIVGAAVARSLCTSAFSRALLYASGMRLKFSTAKAPVRRVEP